MCWPGFFLQVALVLTLAGGFLFGVVWGAVYLMVGLTLGTSLSAFLIARYLAGTWIHSRYEGHLKKFNREVAHYGSSYLLMLRIIPVLPFFAVNFLAGTTKMSVKRFILTTAVGLLPGSVVYTYAGKQLGNITSVDDITTPKLFIGFWRLEFLPFSLSSFVFSREIPSRRLPLRLRPRSLLPLQPS